MIVLLSHCACAFLPAFYGFPGATVHYGWENPLRHTPVYTLVAATVMVYIFFTMSGFVLASSFLNSKLGISQQVIKRLTRLYIPVAFSVVVAAILLHLFALSKNQAAQLTFSTWLAALCENPGTLVAASKDLFLSSMLLGYNGQSIFDGWPFIPPLASMTEAFNTPLWSLHVELWGSMLVIAISAAYRILPRAAFWICFGAVSFFVGTSQYALFMIGFVAYLNRKKLLHCSSVLTMLLGSTALLAGVYLTYSEGLWLAPVLTACSKLTWGHAPGPAYLRCEASAILILLGIAILPAPRRALSASIPAWLGKISFSLYLVHFPILFTLGCWIFVKLTPHLSYGKDIAITTAVVILASLLSASLFELFVDKRAVALSRRIVTTLSPKHSAA